MNLPLCGCGCAERVSKPGNRFIQGDNFRNSEKIIGANHYNWKGGPIEVTCAFCGQSITRESWHAERQANHFCNRECCGRWRSENLRGAKNPNWGRIEATCAFCGQGILRHKFEMEKHSNHFCSRACKGEWMSENATGCKSYNWRGGPIKVACALCGKTILRKNYSAERQINHFCSGACYGEWISENQSGENSPSWQGGGSFEPYSSEFNAALKRATRERDGFTCQLCGVPENGRVHDCHHIDYAKTNNEFHNLNALCRPCHGRTNFNRAFYTNLFQARMKMGLRLT